MILVDTSGLVAAYNRRDRHHDEAREILSRPGLRLLSPLVLAELDYLIARDAGQEVELAMLDDVAAGAYHLEEFSSADVASARAVIQRYRDLRLGLADASLVVLAERRQCWDLLTLDNRHFRAVTGRRGQPFRLLPADAGW